MAGGNRPLVGGLNFYGVQGICTSQEFQKQFQSATK